MNTGAPTKFLEREFAAFAGCARERVAGFSGWNIGHPLRYQLFDQVPDIRDADFPLRRHDERLGQPIAMNRENAMKKSDRGDTNSRPMVPPAAH